MEKIEIEGNRVEITKRFDRSPRAKVAEQRLCPNDTGFKSCRLVVVDLQALKAPKMKVGTTLWNILVVFSLIFVVFFIYTADRL